MEDEFPAFCNAEPHSMLQNLRFNPTLARLALGQRYGMLQCRWQVREKTPQNKCDSDPDPESLLTNGPFP